jgi:hypothetical protein
VLAVNRPKTDVIFEGPVLKGHFLASFAFRQLPDPQGVGPQVIIFDEAKEMLFDGLSFPVQFGEIEETFLDHPLHQGRVFDDTLMETQGMLVGKPLHIPGEG